jgi:hypothetical protein
LNLSELIKAGQVELESDRLEDAEKSFADALQACLTDEERQEVLRSLIKLAGKYMSCGQSDRPRTLYDYLAGTGLVERTRVLEWLARLHLQMEDVAGAEKIYVDIFEERLKQLGADHPDTVGTLKTAALLLQMQGKSPEEFYERAYRLARAVNKTGGRQAGADSKDKGSKVAAARQAAGAEAGGMEAGAPETRKKGKTSRAEPFARLLETTREHQKKMVPKPEEAASSPAAAQWDGSQEKAEGGAGDGSESQNRLPGQGSHLQEIRAAWQSFSSRLSVKLADIFNKNKNPAFKSALVQLLTGLSKTTRGLKPVDFDHPFDDAAGRQVSNELDWKILKELTAVYGACDGSPETYPMEASTIYACLRRAFELGPLHVDTLQNFYRLSYLYARETFGCFDPEFAAAGFHVCLLGFSGHPGVSPLTRVRSCTKLAVTLAAKKDVKAARSTLAETIELTESCELIDRQEVVAFLRSIADCASEIGEHGIAAKAYENLLNQQEAVCRNTEFFDTLMQLISAFHKAGDESSMQKYQQRLIFELDWVENVNTMREMIALKAVELGEMELAELMLHDILLYANLYEPIAGKAMLALIKIYETTGRNEMAVILKERLGG